MGLTLRELAKRDERDAEFRQGQLPAVQAVERVVCGCDYGGTSWATRDEVDQIAVALDLAPGVGLLEVGAGSGWPALYLAGHSGCDVTLVDLPFEGIRIAASMVRMLSRTVAPIRRHIRHCRDTLSDANHDLRWFGKRPRRGPSTGIPGPDSRVVIAGTITGRSGMGARTPVRRPWPSRA